MTNPAWIRARGGGWPLRVDVRKNKKRIRKKYTAAGAFSEPTRSSFVTEKTIEQRVTKNGDGRQPSVHLFKCCPVVFMHADIPVSFKSMCVCALSCDAKACDKTGEGASPPIGC